MSAKYLTVAIPTFNRIEKAKNVLDILHKQVCECVEIVVFDNNSVGGEILMQYCSEKSIKYVKRVTNIGPTGNIVRIFEEANSKWIAVVSDDDTPSDKCIEDMLCELRLLSTKIFAVKFKSELDLQQQVLTIQDINSFTKYISNPHAFGSTLLLSSWVFDVEVLKKYVRAMYLYSGLQCAHIVGVMKGLYGNDGFVKYSERECVKWNPPSKGDSWSSGLTYSLMLSTAPVVDFLNHTQKRQFINGAVGQRTRSIFGNLLRYKLYNHGCAFHQVSLTVASVSLKHFFIVAAFKVVFSVLPMRIVKRYYDAVDDIKGLSRM